jgi:hypothetical protein
MILIRAAPVEGIQTRFAPAEVDLQDYQFCARSAARHIGSGAVQEPNNVGTWTTLAPTLVILMLTGRATMAVPESHAKAFFGTEPATKVEVANETTIKAETPAGTGTVDVVVINSDGQKSTLAKGYNYAGG